MSYEFDLRRHNDKIDDLRQEQELLNKQLPALREQEQLEISRVQRNFNIKVSQVQSRLQGIRKEIEGHERQIESLESKMKDEIEEKKNEEEQRRFRRF